MTSLTENLTLVGQMDLRRDLSHRKVNLLDLYYFSTSPISRFLTPLLSSTYTDLDAQSYGIRFEKTSGVNGFPMLYELEGCSFLKERTFQSRDKSQ